MRQYSFPKRERLLNREDFVNLNRLGKRYHTGHFTVILKKNRLGITRLGITITKKTGRSRLGITVTRKIGNAAKRNKVKRLAREFFRLNKHHFSRGCDIVIIGKKDSFLLNYTDIKEELGEIILNKGFIL